MSPAAFFPQPSFLTCVCPSHTTQGTAAVTGFSSRSPSHRAHFFFSFFFSQLVSPLILEEELLNLRPRGALGSYVSGIFITFLGVIGLPRALKLHLKYLITPRNFGGLILQDSIRGFLLQSEYYILGTWKLSFYPMNRQVVQVTGRNSGREYRKWSWFRDSGGTRDSTPLLVCFWATHQ